MWSESRRLFADGLTSVEWELDGTWSIRDLSSGKMMANQTGDGKVQKQLELHGWNTVVSRGWEGLTRNLPGLVPEA